MEFIQDPNIQKKFEYIRDTLQTLGTSLTEDEDSDEKIETGQSSSFTKILNQKSPAIQKPESIQKSVLPKSVLPYKPSTQMPKQEKPGEKALEKMREKNKELLEKNKELLENLNSLQSILQNKEKEIQSLKDLVDTLTFKENEMKNSIKQLKRQEIELKNEISKLKLEVAELEPLKKQKTPVPRGKYQREASPKSPNPFEIKKFDFERLRIPEKLSASPPLTTRHDKSSKWVCHEIMKMLAVNSLEELIPRLSHLKAHHSKLKKDKQIVEMIAKMMVQCSPEGTFQSSPSCKQIWKWITRLLEEYMKLKQSLEGELIYKLKDMLKVKEMDQMIDALKALLYKLN